MNQQTALLNLQRYFGFPSLTQMARAIGLDKSVLIRATQPQKPRPLSRPSRLQIARFLGRQAGSEENLHHILETTGWTLSEEEWAEALSWMRRERRLYNVPLFLDEGRFVGRTREREALLTRLTDRRASPAVAVVTGLPGVGKSRLVAQIAQEAPALWQRYPDGIFWLDLENSDETHALASLLRDLQGPETAQEPEDPWKVAGRALRGKRALLILDGADRTDLNRWAGLVPSGGLLVTTRRNDIGGPDVQFPLEPMPLEEGRALLLRDNPTVDVEEAEIRWVVEAVDGLPLALHILGRLAHWQGGLRPVVEEMRKRLMDVLEIGERKRESVRVAFGMSYDRLSTDAKALFRFLVGFPQPFPVGPVAYVLDWEVSRVRSAFLDLARAGLVRSEGGERYTMHALLVEYARERLTEEDRAQFENWMTSFASYYGQQTTEAHRLWNRGEFRQALRLWEEHLPCILQGFKYAVSLGRRDWVVEYFRRTGELLALHYRREDLYQWWKTAREMAWSDPERLDVHLLGADWLMQAGMIPEGLEAARQARVLADQLNIPRAQRQAVLSEAQARLILGQVREAAQLLEGNEWEQWEAQADPSDRLLCVLWQLRGTVAEALGRKEVAQVCFLIALQLLEEPIRQGDRWAFRHGADLAWRLGDFLHHREPEAALAFCETAMALAQEAGLRRAWVPAALTRAKILLRLGQIDQAEAALKEARPAALREPMFWYLWAVTAAELARHKQDWQLAEQEFRAALELTRGQAVESEAWRLYGNYLHDRGDMEQAMAAWEKAAEVAHRSGYFFSCALALLRMGEHLWETGKREEALPLFRKVIDIALEIDNPLLISWVNETTGDTEAAQYFQDIAISRQVLAWTDIARIVPDIRWFRIGYLPTDPNKFLVTDDDLLPLVVPLDDIFLKLALRIRPGAQENENEGGPSA